MKNIIKLNLGTNYEYSIRPYVTCDTGAGTQTKSVTYYDFSIVNGATIVVKFTNGNTYNGDIKLEIKLGSATSSYKTYSTDCNHTIPAGGVQEFIYDGSTWRVVGVGGALTSDIENLFK